MIQPGVSCINCGSAYPGIGIPFCCPECGGLFDFTGSFLFDPGKVDRSQPGIWRYRHTFGLVSECEAVSLGEGNTPLVWSRVFGRQVAFKCEYLNPSGSFKDRGSALITAWIKSHAATEAVEDSSGNAGASFAAYAARVGIKARIFVPELASGPKRRQIEAYGAELVPIAGTRKDVADAVVKEAKSGAVYASHAWLPFNLPGYATASYEIVEQLGKIPGAVIVPAGQGGLLLGMMRGFQALRIVNNSSSIPRMIGVQASACAPLLDLFMAESMENAPLTEKNTLAEGVRVRNPLRIRAVLAEVSASCGCIRASEEGEIMPGRAALARLGFYVEPTSAIIWPVLARMLDELPDPVVVILTGSGMKYG
jgi:threonine synthase